MPKDERRRQRAVQRKAARRREKQQGVRSQPRPSVERLALRSAATWPLYECLISRDWQVEGALVEVVVSRRAPAGDVAVGVFLVDLGCLGVKNAFTRMFASATLFESQLRGPMMARSALISADLDLAAKIIREAVAYARQWGFNPQKDYYDAEPLLNGADPDACDDVVPLGLEGKPYFVSGPYDDARAVMDRLMKTAGPGNFHYTVRVEG